jgi:aminoglycoside phosphotransferase (APT) family kinase protein
MRRACLTATHWFGLSHEVAFSRERRTEKGRVQSHPSLDPGTVVALARSSGIAATSASRILEGSSAIATFDVDDAWMFRFAISNDGVIALATERTVLSAVSAIVLVDVGIRVPRYELEGVHHDIPWAAYRKVRGVSGEVLRPEPHRWPRLADQLAAFLAAIHSLPADLSSRQSVPAGGEWIDDLGRYRSLIERAFPDLVTSDVRPYLHGEIARPPGPPAMTFCHADIKGEHLIVAGDGSEVVGVIDWSDACANDPALDLAGLAIWLGPAFVHEVAARSPADDATLEPRALWIARGDAGRHRRDARRRGRLAD